MLRLTEVFSSHALFLHSAPLTVRGSADAPVTVRIERDGRILSEATALPGEGGRFAATLTTPAASFDPCRLVAISGEDSIVCEDILFGELWLAGGQSNMELPNFDHPEYRSLRPRFAAAGVRAYQPTPFPMDDPALEGPDFFGDGKWSRVCDDHFETASALATMCCTILSETLGVPCGFLNLNRGATRLETWLPRSAVTPKIEEHQRRIGRYPTKENWNPSAPAAMYAMKSFNQLSACDRRSSAPLYGVTVRGVLWYQGCSNCMDECQNGMYATTLRALHDAWHGEFGIAGERFPFFMATILPHVYGKETVAPGRFNQALVDLALSDPEEYVLITDNDLTPRWAVHTNNHPVHSIHKYALGERFAKAVLASVYHRGEEIGAPILREVTRGGGAVTLRFAPVGDGLVCADERVRGVYVAGADGNYLPADCEIVAPDTLRVTHPAIAEPCEVVYSSASHEIGANLCAAGMAVAPFLTAPREEWPDIYVQVRPWCDLTLDSDFQYRTATDSYPRAIYRPLPGSGVCFDRTNSLGPRSLRVYAEEKDATFGAEVLRRTGAELDLGRYTALAASVFPARALCPSLVLTLADGSTVTVPGERGEDGRLPEWVEYRFPLAALKDATVYRLAFTFTAAEGEVAGANIDRIYLIP